MKWILKDELTKQKQRKANKESPSSNATCKAVDKKVQDMNGEQ